MWRGNEIEWENEVKIYARSNKGFTIGEDGYKLGSKCILQSI